MKKTVWFDMDNTIVERRNWQYWREVAEGKNMQSYELIPTTDNYNALLELAREFMRNGYEIGVLTKVPPKAKEAGFDKNKMQWLINNEFPVENYTSVVTDRKYEFMRKEDILIDDDEKTRNLAMQAGYMVLNPKDIQQLILQVCGYP